MCNLILWMIFVVIVVRLICTLRSIFIHTMKITLTPMMQNCQSCEYIMKNGTQTPCLTRSSSTVKCPATGAVLFCHLLKKFFIARSLSQHFRCLHTLFGLVFTESSATYFSTKLARLSSVKLLHHLCSRCRPRALLCLETTNRCFPPFTARKPDKTNFTFPCWRDCFCTTKGWTCWAAIRWCCTRTTGRVRKSWTSFQPRFISCQIAALSLLEVMVHRQSTKHSASTAPKDQRRRKTMTGRISTWRKWKKWHKW